MVAASVQDKDTRLLQFPQSGTLLRSIMENAAVGMALAGLDGRLTYVNNAYAEMLRCRPEDCIGLSAGDLVVPEERLLAAEYVRRLMGGEIERYRVERRYLRRDGSGWFWGLASATLLRHETTGQPFTIVVQVTDIDRQKQAETALADAESRWNFALEGSGQGVWDHHIVERRAFFSRTWKAMRGYAADEELDGAFDAWIERVHPHDRERIAEAVRRQDSGEIPYNAFEYRERHKDGRWIWILSRGKPVEWTSDGRPARVIGTDTDISALKDAEAALAEERETLRVTLQSIADGVIATDRAGNITFINSVAAQMTGWQAEAAQGRSVDQVFSLTDARGGCLPNPVTESLAQGRRRYVDEDAVLRTRCGGCCDVRCSVSLIAAHGREASGAVLVFQDVSRARAVQRELEHSARHDGLTGLPNRTAFEGRLADMLSHAGSDQRSHVLCFVDLDRFKDVNDRSGHAAGDALLCEVARTLRSGVRRDDFVARIGGDEFALIVADCPLEDALAIANSLVAAISALTFEWQGVRHRVGASIGMTPIGSGAVDMPGVLAEADAACYIAKAQGRNRVAVSEAQRADDHTVRAARARHRSG